MGAGYTRRGLLERACVLGLATAVGQALPLAGAAPARAAMPSLPDATLQAFADTLLPGRKVARTDLGNDVHPLAIAGVDPDPGAVEADALALFHHPEVGFDAVAPAFLADLETRALAQGGPFLNLPFERRTAVCLGGLDFSNPVRLVWEAAAAVPFTAFCAAALVPEQTAEKACGYRGMGLPGVASSGYADASWGRRLARERTRTGSLR